MNKINMTVNFSTKSATLPADQGDSVYVAFLFTYGEHRSSINTHTITEHSSFAYYCHLITFSFISVLTYAESRGYAHTQ